MEASALRHHHGAAVRHGRSPLLRLQSDERLVALARRGSAQAFEALVARYESRLLGFCRHMLGSREDAEDVLQEVFAAAYNAMLADERPINVRPWLYRIARNRSLNHLRRVQPIGVDSMDHHLSEAGKTTAEKVHEREEFRLLVQDVQGLPETQRTALLLREIEALSYDQIAVAMETTVPSVKSLLVRARVGLAEAAEARLLTCEQVRLELGEVAEGLKKISPPVRRHLRTCERCAEFRRQLKRTNKALAAVYPVGPLVMLKKLLVSSHVGGSGAAAGGGAAAATAGSSVAGGLLTAGSSALASKAVAGLTAAALVTAGAVEVNHVRDRAADDRAVAQVAPGTAGDREATPEPPAPAPVPAADGDPARDDGRRTPERRAETRPPERDRAGDAAEAPDAEAGTTTPADPAPVPAEVPAEEPVAPAPTATTEPAPGPAPVQEEEGTTTLGGGVQEDEGTTTLPDEEPSPGEGHADAPPPDDGTGAPPPHDDGKGAGLVPIGPRPGDGG